LNPLRLRSALAAAATLSAAAAAVAAPPVALDAMTSPEVRARIDAGARTVLLPIGGTEQNGAHLVLGKHNVRAPALALRIAQALGDALVAPVLAYVPEGRVDPPGAHMRWAGTISVPEAAFEGLLDGAAASLCRHGFRDVVLLGDHGGYQPALQRVAARQRKPGCRVTALSAYYRAAQADFPAWLSTQGYGAGEIGTHAGLADTALSLAIDTTLVRPESQARGAGDGVSGDPRRATAELGRPGVNLIVERSVQAIRALPAAR
jgi:creatinine amidohydrolase/Fe(II)-dependent formamide hydrolase-like protein